jgi:hypothetical protein
VQQHQSVAEEEDTRDVIKRGMRTARGYGDDDRGSDSDNGGMRGLIGKGLVTQTKSLLSTTSMRSGSSSSSSSSSRTQGRGTDAQTVAFIHSLLL